MPIRLVTADVWQTIAKNASKARVPSHAAVAYLGKGGADLLPLPTGSLLVVDASSAAVRSGQTHPLDLLALHSRGIIVHSCPQLHAKVFVFDRLIIVGSANASKHSARVLQEAVVEIDDERVIRAGRKYVTGLCVAPLGPAELKRLQKLYRPPRVPGHATPPSGVAGTTVYVARTFDKE